MATTQVIEGISERATARVNLTGTSTSSEGKASKDVSKWIVLAAASAVIFVGVGITNTFGVFEDFYKRNLFPDRASSELLVIGSTASSLYLILGAFTGRFADLLGHQLALAIGAVCMVGALVAASFAQDYYQLFLSQGLLFGLGVAFAYYPALSIPRQYLGGKNHGLASGIIVSGGAVGGCVLPYIVQVSLNRGGLASTFRLLAYISAGLLIPSIALLRPKKPSRTPIQTQGRRLNNDDNDSNDTPQPTNPSRTITTTTNSNNKLLDLSLLRDTRFLILLTAATIAMTGFLPRYFFTTTSAIDRGVDAVYATWLLGIMNGLSVIGRVGIGSFADRYGKVLALAVSFVMCGLGHLLFWLPAVLVPGGSTATGSTAAASAAAAATPTALFTLFVVFVGILGSGFISLFPVVVSELFGSEQLASKMGLMNSVVGLGVLAGPSAVSAIVAADSWSIGVVTSGLLMVVGGLAVSGILRFEERKDVSGQRRAGSDE